MSILEDSSLQINNSIERISRQSLKQLEKRVRAYKYLFIVALILCWSPSNALGYLVPWIAIAIFIAYTFSKQTVARLLIVFVLWLLISAVHYPLTPNFVVHSAILSFVTYGTFIFLICIPTKKIASERSIYFMERVARWMLLLQSIIGIGQSFYGFSITGSFDVANGDYVEGTIHPALAAEKAFSNPIFAVNIVMLLLFLLPSFVIYKKGQFAFLLGLAALVLASVLHVLLFAGAATFFAVIYYNPALFRKKYIIYPALVFIVVVGLSAILLRKNISTVSSFVQAALNQQTPRTEVIYRTLQEMPADYPFMPLIGLGPGQFSSLAGLIGTGEYFGTPKDPRPLPLLPQAMSLPFQENVYDLWLYIALNDTGNNTSSTYKPYFSWLSIYSEWGILGITVTILLVVGILCSIKVRYLTKTQSFYAISLGTGVAFIFLLGMQENYWEISQAIFPGVVMLKAQYSILMSTAKWN